MAIVNVTPDSFYDGGKYTAVDSALALVERYLEEGADIVDIGGMSTRPGAEMISSDQECRRILPVIDAIVQRFPAAIISVDTVYADTVRAVYQAGVHMINDVSAGKVDSHMYEAVRESGLPYILMHMLGAPTYMQDDPRYDDVVLQVATALRNEVKKLQGMGVKDIIIDPGFGFGKTIQHNYNLLNHMDNLQWIGCPILTGLSRKSMVYKKLNITSKDALLGTMALNMVALERGASILRVHDVAAARQAVTLHTALHESEEKSA